MANYLVPVSCALLLALAFIPATNAVTCYQCSGSSGFNTLVDSTLKTHCGLPFRDNDANALLTRYTCEGVCVTHTVYAAGGSTVYRSCTDLPVWDGCRENRDFQGQTIGWECLKQCTTDLCNTGNDASSLVASRFSALFLASAVAAFVKRFA